MREVNLMEENISRDANPHIDGPIESVSIGEIKLSSRQSLVEVGVGSTSWDPKLQLVICNLEVVTRPSIKSSGEKKKPRKSSSGGSSGKGKGKGSVRDKKNRGCVRERKPKEQSERKPTQKTSNIKVASNSSLHPPPIFVGEYYHLQATEMKTSLRVQSLKPNNSSNKKHNDEMTKEGKTLVIIHLALHDDVFIKILTLESTKKAWDKLKEEIQGSERTKRI
ncbi:Protein SABRE, partial [Mucuna pruriens]